MVATDLLGVIRIAADVQLAVLPVHKLTPAVAGTDQHVVEALVILHEIREDMLLSVLHQMLHMRSVAFHAHHALGIIIRYRVVGQLFLQDMIAELLRRPRLALARQRQQLVQTVYLQLHYHRVGIVARTHLLHVVVVAHDVDELAVGLVAVVSHCLELHLLMLEEHFYLVTLKRFPYTVRLFAIADTQVGQHLCRLVHFLLETEVHKTHLVDRHIQQAHWQYKLASLLFCRNGDLPHRKS